ncbi:chemotaxis protein CheW [Aquabacterium humicola]|uniref:chemotaxis protein CheW n=1 Tax=Aquabacterium humicola TaxID=3237377 RepID=UPI0032EEDB3D
MRCVQEVLGYERPCSIAGVPAYLVGRIRRGQSIIPVVDLRVHFGVSNPTIGLQTAIVRVAAGALLDGRHLRVQSSMALLMRCVQQVRTLGRWLTIIFALLGQFSQCHSGGGHRGFLRKDQGWSSHLNPIRNHDGNPSRGGRHSCAASAATLWLDLHHFLGHRHGHFSIAQCHTLRTRIPTIRVDSWLGVHCGQ